jgi:hypothetical protein
MKWFDNWFAKQCQKAWNGARTDTDEMETVSYAAKVGHSKMSKHKGPNDSDIIEDVACYTFKMQPAEGGTIVQIMHYVDNQKNQNGDWVKDLYVIPDSKDFGEELTSILVQYKLKHM